ncbi:MAG: glycosyltransferase family 4 protein [Bacteroidota bacterium]|nr:glycosyltransferase family 4 protein [Bacteroidota bacterium]
MTKKIKILECIRQGKIGGGESHLLSLIEHLDRSRFEPVVLSFTDGPMIDRLRQMNVPAEVIYTEKPFDFRVWGRVKKFLQRHAVELVHAHGTRANSNVLWASRSLGIPVIYTVHGWSFHQDQHPLVRRIRVMGEKYLVSHAARNISVSSSNQRSGKDRIPSFDSIVINNGIDGRKFDPEGRYPDIRAELGIPAGATLVLFIARFTAHKQPLSLLEAFAQALPKDPDLHLLMVGEGDQQAMALERVAALGLGDKVHFQAFRQDVPAVLAAADLFVLPSLWEGLPIGLLEAMAMGKAVIATRVDGTSEILQDGVNGSMIETDGLIDNLRKALLALSKDPARRREYGRKAIETVQGKYNAARMTRQIEELYLNLAGHSGPALKMTKPAYHGI